MKKLFLPTSILISSVLLQSCSKQNDEMVILPQITSNARVINATIKSTGIYQLSLSSVQKVTIAKQASHFQVSEAGYDSKTSSMIYKYIPAQDFVGSDEVLLSTSNSTISSGTGTCGNRDSHTNSTVTTSNISVKINVTN